MSADSPDKYTLRRTSDGVYQLEKPDGSILVGPIDAATVDSLPSDPDTYPNVPADIAQPVVTHLEDNLLLDEWRLMQWVGVRYIDDR